MSKWRWVIVGMALLCLILGTILFTFPEQKQPMAKIGILLVNDNRLAKVEGLKEGLERLGYREGLNITYQVSNDQNQFLDLSTIANRLIADNPDVLVAAGGVEAQTLKEQTAKMKNPIPVIFMGTLSPISIGLVSDSFHPEGNLTGLNNYHLELTPKRLELLHRLLPDIQHVAVLGDTRVPFYKQIQFNIQKTAKDLSLTLGMYTVSSPEEVAKAFQQMSNDKVESIILLPGFFLETSTTQVVELAMQNKLPVFGVYPSDTEEGCLASYGTPYKAQGAQTAQLIYKILRGQTPKDLPVETPEDLVFSVNLRTAQQLGIRLAPNVFSFADQVIQP